MFRFAVTASTAAAVALSLAGPLPADAAAAARSYTLQTRIFEQAPSAGEYDGSLQLSVSADGIVSGYYRPDENPRFIPVNGGVAGDRLWLDIGGAFTGEPMRFNGTLHDGTIRAAADRPVVDDGRYTALELVGTPRRR